MSTPIILHAAFFMEGLHDAGYNRAIHAWDNGCLEMVSAMCSHAPFVHQLVTRLESTIQDLDYPGVLDYEVSSPFGKWWGSYVIEHKRGPDAAACQMELRRLLLTFFSQGTASDRRFQLQEVLI